MGLQPSIDMKQTESYSALNNGPEGKANSHGKSLSGNWSGFNQGTGVCLAVFQEL